MASEKIDALELDINAKLTTENLDKLITALGRLSKALDKVNAKRVKEEVKDTGDASKTAAVKIDGLTDSFLNQTVRITALVAVYRKLADVISSGISNSMQYIENLNLFTVSLGEYSANAQKYAETVRSALGIDYSEWERTQGVFNTLIEGFGVTGDKAAYMSQNLTQLTYDIASFYNLSFSEAEKKLQSAVAGELEPVRRIGYDLSQAKLTAIAQNPENYGKTTYAINEETGALEANTVALDENLDRQIANFNELTQAEKVQLRYIALMTQVTEVQGDLSRTLNDPANQIRVFREQLSMTSRELGNVFIPMLNQVLPYLTAFFQVVEEGLHRIATYLGFELPDMSDRMNVSDDVPYYENIVEATGRAAKNAKKMKDYMIGIDELNVIRPVDDTPSGGSGSTPNYGNLSTDLYTPGYDFLTSAITNRVKEAKQEIEGFVEYLKSLGTLGSIGFFTWEGAGELGSKLWEKILGKTPEELAQEAYNSGKPVWLQFYYALADQAGTPGSAILSLLFGDPEELGAKAYESGKPVWLQFYYGIADTIGTPGEALMKLIFGDPDELAERADKTGSSMGTQFAVAFAYKVLDMFTSSPILKAWYEFSTGRNADADIALLQKAMGYTKAKEIPKKVNNTLGNTSADEARKRGEEAAKNYADGWTNYESVVGNAGNSIYNTIWKGVTNNGNANSRFKSVSSLMASSYVSGLLSGTPQAKSAGSQLYSSAYNGVSSNTANFSNLGSTLANAFASALGSQKSKSNAYNSAWDMANNGSNGAYSLYGDFVWTGEMAGQGYVGGIGEYRDVAERMGSLVAKSTLYKLQQALGIASPSKKTYEAGMFFDLGFANAVKDYTKNATDAANEMAYKSVQAIQTTNSMFSGVSIPTRNNMGFGMGAMNEGAMASLASNIYQAVVSGVSTLNLNEDREVNVIIDGKEVFKVVQSEARKRGADISNGAFSR